MADLSQLSNDQLQQLYAINKNESGGAPDSSTVKNSGSTASGSMQVVAGTRKDPGFGVKPSDGTPQDTAREGRDYYLALKNKYQDPMTTAIAYNWGPGNTDKWLSEGGDLSQLPDDQLKYAHNFSKNATPATPTPSATPLSSMSDEDLQKLHQQTQGDKGSGFMANLEGAGLQGANIVAGGLEALPIAAHAAGSAIANQSLQSGIDTATKDFSTFSPENALQKMGVDTSNADASAVSQGVNSFFDKAFNTVPNMLGEGMARTGELEAGMSPSQYTPEAGQQAGNVIRAGMLAEPMLHVPGMIRGIGRDAGAAGELDKLNATGAPEGPATQASNMGPNEGPQRPAITVDSRGNAVDPLSTDPNMQAYVAAAQQQQRMAQSGAPGFGPQPNPDTMGPNDGPQLPTPTNPTQTSQGEFVGPPRPAITVDRQGVATDPLSDQNMAEDVRQAQMRQGQ